MSKTDNSGNNASKDAEGDRKRRLADALRDNLKRRKAAQRAVEKSGPGPASDGNEDEGCLR